MPLEVSTLRREATPTVIPREVAESRHRMDSATSRGMTGGLFVNSMTPLIEQEIYIIERYSSTELFGQMRALFKDVVATGWAALDEYMRHLPRDYRSKPLYDQPDAVWGELVLRNFQQTADGLDRAWLRLTEGGDRSAIEVACNVGTAFTGMIRDYSAEWMPEPFKTRFYEGQHKAWDLARQINFTVLCGWNFRDLYYPTWAEEKRKWDFHWELFPPPATWPVYKLNPEVQIRTDEKALQTGIYLPEVDESCPELIFAGRPAWEANIGRDEYGHRCAEAKTLWTLVERIADEGGPIPGQEPWREDYSRPMRAEGGEVCPREGYWWSPANQSKGRVFKKGEIMPIVTSTEYATCYWLWGGEIGKK
jgi:hypothetical protein